MPNAKQKEPSKNEEEHNAPTKVQLQRSDKHVVVFQWNGQSNQHEAQNHQESAWRAIQMTPWGQTSTQL